MEVAKKEQEDPGTYIGLKLDEESQKRIVKFMKDNDIPEPLTKSKLHVTLMYSPKPSNEVENMVDPERTYECIPTEFALFGDDENALVMKMDGEDIHKRHDDMIEAGAEHTFTPFSPHITLTYDAGKFDIESLTVPQFKVTLTKEYYEPLNPDWKKDNIKDDDE